MESVDTQMQVARRYTYLDFLLLGTLWVSSCASQPPKPVEISQPQPKLMLSPSPTTAQIPESSPKRVSISRENVYSPENYEQILLIEGYLDPQGFVCDAIYCWTDLCPKPGCNVAYGGKQAVGV